VGVYCYNVDKFTDAYIKCALWTTFDESKLNLNRFSISNISDDTIKEMIADCKKFQEKVKEELEEAYDNIDYNETKAGIDFWFTRNHHSAGFWDRGLYSLGKNLIEIAHGFGGYDLYLGENGEIDGSS
jgi:hypothetical protein